MNPITRAPRPSLDPDTEVIIPRVSRERPAEVFVGIADTLVGDLRSAFDRWPLFAPQAARSGFLSVHALPLRLRSEVIGALNLFGSKTSTPAPADVHIVQALANIATIGLLQERAIRRAEILAEQLQGALNSRVVIEQAKGALSRIHGVDVDHAFQMMRAYARSTGHKLGEVAHAVVTEPASLPQLTRPDPGSATGVP